MGMFQMDDIYKWLVRMYAYEYPDNPLNQLNINIAKIRKGGKSLERAVLELALQSGLKLSELEHLEEKGKTRGKAISAFLRGKKLLLKEDDREIREIVERVGRDKRLRPSTRKATREKAATQQWNWMFLGRIFLHGLSFSVVMSGLVFLWAFLLVLLVAVGSFIGLLIGFVILLFILGGLNSFLLDRIWSISTETGWKNLLGHGFVLSIALIAAHIPGIFVSLIAPGLATMVVLFIINAFIDGLIAKNVVRLFEHRYKFTDSV
ncbi:MAG: hypothetical protein JSW53_04965 [Candidatus Bathyarchaeota archaeon]|nr:MAG: hypothetical protein JSW53_04965 [Candidatus Bathyarchaeota archaeon]